jgi:hypothetical protein
VADRPATGNELSGGTLSWPGTAPPIAPPIPGGLVVARKSGLIIPRGVSYGNWEMIGEQIFTVVDSSTWWIADWLAYGESTYHDRYQEAIQKTSLNYQTLRNYAWVARRFELSRRRDNLSFGHHAEVSALDQPEQDYWLRKAEELGWSRNHTRQEVRNSLRDRRGRDAIDRAKASSSGVKRTDGDQDSPAMAGTSLEMKVSLGLTGEQFKRYNAAAQSVNLPLEDWAVRVLEAATTC